MTIMDAPSTDLVRTQALMPLAPDDARAAMAAYQELCRSILVSDDMQRVGDRSFVKRSGFSKLAAAYGVSTEIVSQQIDEVEREDGDETVTVLVARAVVRATHPTGRHAEGDGACSSNEKRFRRGAEKIDHDLPATAVTRATNRAISNLVAFGTVSAEEAEAGGNPETGQAQGGNRERTPSWAAPAPDIGAVAHALTELFRAAGVEDAGIAAVDVGNAVFKGCDGTVPVCVARAIDHIVTALAPETVPEAVDATATETTETTTQEEAA